MPYELLGLASLAAAGLLCLAYSWGYRRGYSKGARIEALRARWEGQERTARILAKVGQYGDLAGIQLGLAELEDEEGPKAIQEDGDNG